MQIVLDESEPDDPHAAQQQVHEALQRLRQMIEETMKTLDDVLEHGERCDNARRCTVRAV